MLVTCRPCATPATAASVAPTANATTMIRSTLMPIRRAVSGSCETACMQRPVGDALHEDRRRDRGDDRSDDHEGQHPEGGVALEEDQPGREGAERTDHEDLAVGEVDQLDDAVDDRVADRDQGVE